MKVTAADQEGVALKAGFSEARKSEQQNQSDPATRQRGRIGAQYIPEGNKADDWIKRK